MFIVIYDLDRLLSAPIFSPILILNDEYEDEPVFEFHRYADSLLRIITGSSPRYSIGIYGDWGTGKTTLMKLLQHKLDEYKEGDIPITWSEITDGNKQSRFRKYLRDYYDVNNLQGPFNKNNKKNIAEFRVIYNAYAKLQSNRRTSIRNFFGNLYSKLYGNAQDMITILSLEIVEKSGKNEAIMRINNRITDRLRVTKVAENLTIHFPERKIITVWFNAWRYEREEQLSFYRAHEKDCIFHDRIANL